MTVLVVHDPGCKYARPADGGHTDAAKRAADAYNLHLLAGAGQVPNPSVGQWLAVALADGRSDGVLYQTRADAVRHQHHNEQLHAYMRVVPSSMSVCAAEAFLRMHRLAYDNGFRLADPEAPGGGREIIPRLSREEFAAQITALERRTWPVQRTS